MKVQVLGSGCPTCKKLYELTKQAVNDLGSHEVAVIDTFFWYYYHRNYYHGLFI